MIVAAACQQQYTLPYAIVFGTAMIFMATVSVVVLWFVANHRKNQVTLSMDEIYANTRPPKEPHE